MADNKPTLTRRRVLGGVATIGVAGALGSATWAQYNDQETAGPINAEAATMDLAINNPASRNVKVEPVGGNADGFSETFVLENNGNITGNALTLNLDQVSSGEGSFNRDPETNTGGNGELDEQLEVRAWVEQFNGVQYFFGGSDSWEDYNSVKGEENAVTKVIGLEPNDERLDLVIEGRMKDLSGNQNNNAMGDTLSFDVVATLHQQNTA
jgi:spore coat-associated protein N